MRIRIHYNKNYTQNKKVQKFNVLDVLFLFSCSLHFLHGGLGKITFFSSVEFKKNGHQNTGPGIRIHIETNADPFHFTYIYLFSATTTTTRCHQGRTAPTTGSPTTDPRQIRAKAPTPALAVSLFLFIFYLQSEQEFSTGEERADSFFSGGCVQFCRSDPGSGAFLTPGSGIWDG
jgi:hypothetical protein